MRGVYSQIKEHLRPNYPEILRGAVTVSTRLLLIGTLLFITTSSNRNHNEQIMGQVAERVQDAYERGMRHEREITQIVIESHRDWASQEDNGLTPEMSAGARIALEGLEAGLEVEPLPVEEDLAYDSP